MVSVYDYTNGSLDIPSNIKESLENFVSKNELTNYVSKTGNSTITGNLSTTGDITMNGNKVVTINELNDYKQNVQTSLNNYALKNDL